MAINRICFLPNAVYTTGPLNQTDDRPRQVIIHDDGTVLEVLPLAEYVGCQQDPEFVFRFDDFPLFVALRTKLPRNCRRIFRVTAHALQTVYPASFELFRQVL